MSRLLTHLALLLSPFAWFVHGGALPRRMLAYTVAQPCIKIDLLTSQPGPHHSATRGRPR